jgi:hypothetical protein
VKILDRLPIPDAPITLFVGSDAVTIKRFQIGVWVSINDVHRPFLAVLDTGHTHNFSITQSQLRTYAGLTLNDLRFIGTTKLKGERLRQYEAMVRIHCNRRGTAELGEGSFPLITEEGISLAPEGSSRLPLLGLRALVHSNLRLVIDGKKRRSSGFYVGEGTRSRPPQWK